MAGLRRLTGSMSARLLAPASAVLLCAGVGLTVAVAGGEKASLVGGVLLVLAVTAPLCLRLRTDPLDAVGIYGVASAAFLGFASLLWLGTPAEPGPGIHAGDIAPALVLSAAALTSFGAMARFTGGVRRVPPVRIRKDASPSLRVLVVVFALSMIATVIGIAFGAFGFLSSTRGINPQSGLLGASELAKQLSGVGALVVLACALVGFATNDRRLLVAVLVFTAIQVGAGFLLGTKIETITPIVYVVLAYIATRGRIPWRPLVISALVLVVVMIPANKAYRAFVRPQEGASAPTPTSIAQQSYSYVGDRLRLIDNVALIQNQTPSVYAYGNGSRYALLPAVVVVPRVVWPGKPVLDFGQEFSRTYWQLPAGDTTGTGTTQIGDLYRNFHVVGAVIGLGIWGLVVGGLTALRRRWRTPRMEMVYIASLITWVWIIEQDLPTLITTMARAVPVTILLAWLLLPGPDGPPGYRRILSALRKLRADAPEPASPGR